MAIPKTIKIKKIDPTTPSPSSRQGRGSQKAAGRRGNTLPATPGVYLFRDKKGKVVYVGKATNLKSRVRAYFLLRHPERSEGSRGSKDGILQSPRGSLRMTGRGGRPIDEMLHEVRRIDWITTDSVIEALILEANLIKKYLPIYNIKAKDDKSFLYVVVTKEQWPKVVLVRGSELVQYRYLERRSAQAGSEEPALSLSKGSRGCKDGILRSPRGSLRMTGVEVWKVFGPYTSASSIRAALDLIRKWFPWSTCKPKTTTTRPYTLAPRPCFNFHIGRCPGVCIGVISRREYMKNIRNVILMLEGKKGRVISNVEREMQRAAQDERFEEAEKLKRKLFALQHIRDVAVLTHDTNLHEFKKRIATNTINILGRIEGYDISNISGTSAVGSMVVFENGEPSKSEYKRFKIKTVQGINDVAMMREVLMRRFSHTNWPLPELIVIDGGWGQVNAVQEIMVERGLRIPIVGIAKGFKRKQDRPIFDKDNAELARIVVNYKDLLLRVRDEAHRFAIAYHRKVRSRRLST